MKNEGWLYLICIDSYYLFFILYDSSIYITQTSNVLEGCGNNRIKDSSDVGLSKI